MSSRVPEPPSRGGSGGGFVKDLLPSGPLVTEDDLRNAGLALCRSAVAEANLPFPLSRTRLSDLTVDQGDGLVVALRALGVAESPEPEWYRDQGRHLKRRPRSPGDTSEQSGDS